MRKMATIRKIADVVNIEGADKIQQYIVDGWSVVDQKGKYRVGDLVVFCEIDSWIPHGIAPFLSKGREPRGFNGVKGEKLRTVRLRGALSQGLLLPHDILGEQTRSGDYHNFYDEGDDVSEALGIQKYEPPISPQLSGTVKGNFPSFIPKTDQERVQNVKPQNLVGVWFVTEKLEGSSMTVYYKDGEFGVCSRNMDLKRDENNTFWKVAIENNLEEILKANDQNLALQGELIGPGIQGNIYKLDKHEFRLFDVFDIDKQKYFTSDELINFSNTNFIERAPVEFSCFVINDYALDTVKKELLSLAEGSSSLYNTQREGLVFVNIDDPSVSFKAISNKYLLGSTND